MQLPERILQMPWRRALMRATMVVRAAEAAAFWRHDRTTREPSAGARGTSSRGLMLGRSSRRTTTALQWTRLVAIIEKGFAQVAAVGAAHARAVEAVEATDEMLSELLADLAAIGVLPQSAIPIAVEERRPPASIVRKRAA